MISNLKAKGGKKKVRPVRLIACGVFRSFLEYIRIEKLYPDLLITFLPSNLHLFPFELKALFLKEVKLAQERGERIICLYGNCFQDMDILCRGHGIIKVPGNICYEMFLGNEEFRKIMDETTGTFFFEKDLILNFEEYCIKPLELNDEEIKRFYFKDYLRVIYIRQPSDPELCTKAEDLARFLGLSFELRNADYTHLEKMFMKLMDSELEQENEKEKQTDS